MPQLEEVLLQRTAGPYIWVKSRKTRSDLLNVKATRDAGDADALVALAETDDMAWRGSPMLMCAVAEGLIVGAGEQRRRHG